MNFIKYEFTAGPDNVVQVELSGPANVRLLDRPNFRAFQQGRSHNFFGGQALRRRVQLRPPRLGNWVVVVDTGGTTSVRASCRVLRGGAP